MLNNSRLIRQMQTKNSSHFGKLEAGTKPLGWGLVGYGEIFYVRVNRLHRYKVALR